MLQLGLGLSNPKFVSSGCVAILAFSRGPNVNPG